MKAVFAVGALMAALAITGCSSIINNPQGKVVSITERGLGFKVSQSASTQSPQVEFGFFSSAVVFLPTQTNGTVATPNFANTFDFSQQGALSLGIGENIASGNYQTLTPNATNSAPAVQPVVPK